MTGFRGVRHLVASNISFLQPSLRNGIGSTVPFFKIMRVGFTGAQDILPQDWDEQTALSYIKGVTPAMLRDMALVGTPREVIEQAAEWRDCGVRHVVLYGSPMQRSLRNGLASMAPFVKVMRGLKRL